MVDAIRRLRSPWPYPEGHHFDFVFLFRRFRRVVSFAPATRPISFPRTKMRFHQLQPLLLPSALVALALIGLNLLLVELQTPGKRSEREREREKKRQGLLKVFSHKKRFQKAS